MFCRCPLRSQIRRPKRMLRYASSQDTTLLHIPLTDLTTEKRRKAIEILTGRKEEKYFLLRHAVDGPWKDDLGKKYHIGRKKNGSMGNLVQEIRDAGVGTKTVWWTASGVNAYFWGFGTVSKIETISEDKDWNLLYDDFKMFEGDADIQGRMLKKATETVNQHIHDLEDNKMAFQLQFHAAALHLLSLQF